MTTVSGPKAPLPGTSVSSNEQDQDLLVDDAVMEARPTSLLATAETESDQEGSLDSLDRANHRKRRQASIKPSDDNDSDGFLLSTEASLTITTTDSTLPTTITTDRKRKKSRPSYTEQASSCIEQLQADGSEEEGEEEQEEEDAGAAELSLLSCLVATVGALLADAQASNRLHDEKRRECEQLAAQTV